MTTTSPPGPTATELEQALEAHRRELTGYCYRMLGSPAEAEDAVQDTMLQAWRALDRWEGRSSLRTWLYRIAHNVCIDMHRSPQRRARPMDLGPSTRTAQAVLGEPTPEHAWVQPVLDTRVVPEEGDPAAVAEARESVRLAFVAALQRLPARQRSALILCEVLKWSAAETAALLETSTASVNSALQRARATMAEAPAAQLDPLEDPEHQRLLAAYVDAFERYDMDALVALLRDDVVMSMPPFDLWLEGPSDVIDWMVGPGAACEGSRLVPVSLNGTAGFASYKAAGDGTWLPWALQVIEVRDGLISGHHNFLAITDPGMFERYGLPGRLPPTPEGAP